MVGPDPESFFVRIGLAMSYAFPLVLLSFGLIGHAISFRSERLAFAAGLMVSFTGTAAYLLNLRVSGLLTMEQWVRLGQLNAILASLYGMGWLGVVWLRRRRHAAVAPTDDGWRRTQLAIASGFLLLPTVAMAIVVFADPRTRAAVEVAAGLWGWTALTLVTIFLSVSHGLQGRRVSPAMALLVIDALLILAALQLRTWPVAWGTRWWTYHSLQIAAVLAALAALAIEFQLPRRLQPTVPRLKWLATSPSGDPLLAMISSLPAIALLLLSLRSAPFDPQAHWWSVGGLIGVAGLCVFRGSLRDRQRYYWFAAFLWSLAASIWFVAHGHKWMGSGPEAGLNFFYWNVFALALPVPLWTVLRRRDSKRFRPPWLVLHTTATLGALLLLGWSVGLGLFEDAEGGKVAASLGVTILALAATAWACISCLWDPRSRWAVAFCYLAGLIATGAMLDRLNLDANSMIWVSTLLLSAYGLATSYLWSRRAGLQQTLQQLGVPAESENRLASQSWLIPFNGCLALAVCVLGIWVQFTCDNAGLRLAGSQAVAAQALAVGLLARGRRETELRFVALLIGVVAAVCFGWSWLSPEISGQWLNRWVVLATSLLGVAVLYGVGLVKLIRRENAWTEAASRLVPGLVAAGAVAGLVVLGSESYLFVRYGSAHMGLPGIVAVAGALLAVAIACLIAAVVPGRDPFGLSDKQRTVYVYGAEVLVALLCLHLRVTMPELFTGFVQRYWSMVVMALAFVGVGFSEWFRRRRQMVLAEPLEKTGILLPLLPVLGFFVAPSQDVHFSLVLLAVGALYAALSVMRRSFGFGLLAVLAANGGFWYFLHDTAQISFFSHPQLWLVPLAVCVLVAAYLNRAN